MEEVNKYTTENNPELIAESILIIKEWITKQPHLPQDIEDTWIETFLCGCKNSVERCKKLLDNYCTFRTCFPEYYTNRDPAAQDMQELHKYVFRFIVPGRTPEGYYIGIAGVQILDPAKYSPEHELKMLCMIRDHWIRRRFMEIVMILDGKDINFELMNKALPHVQKMILILVIHVHSDIESLYAYIPKDLLPYDYGGKAGTINDMNEATQTNLESMRSWFLSDEKRKTDESKRSKETIRNEMFALDGTFRKLQID